MTVFLICSFPGFLFAVACLWRYGWHPLAALIAIAWALIAAAWLEHVGMAWVLSYA